MFFPMKYKAWNLDSGNQVSSSSVNFHMLKKFAFGSRVTVWPCKPSSLTRKVNDQWCFISMGMLVKASGCCPCFVALIMNGHCFAWSLICVGYPLAVHP